MDLLIFVPIARAGIRLVSQRTFVALDRTSLQNPLPVVACSMHSQDADKHLMADYGYHMIADGAGSLE